MACKGEFKPGIYSNVIADERNFGTKKKKQTYCLNIFFIFINTRERKKKTLIKNIYNL